MNQLAHIAAAKRELDAATDIFEVKTVRDKAAVMENYLRQQGDSLIVQNRAAELKLFAERRLGKLLNGVVTRGYKSLPDGVSRKQSSHWQLEASVPDREFTRYVASRIDRGEELTTLGLLKIARLRNANTTLNGKHRTGVCDSSDLGAIVESGIKFGTIYADPPWQYDNQGTRAATNTQYPTMSVEDIADLPVSELAEENAHLHLWTTNAFLFSAKEVLEAWGFTYKSVFVWVKTEMGIGNYWRVSHEFMLLGVRGKCPFLDHAEKSWMEASRMGGHSKKPEAVRERIERVSPGPRLELFGRETRQDWVVWGNDITRTLFVESLEEFA